MDRRDEIYNEATLKDLGENPTGSRMDVIKRAMSAYAEEIAVGFAAYAVNDFEENERLEPHKLWRSVIDESVYTTKELFLKYITNIQSING